MSIVKPNTPVYTISVAAQLSGLHPQTLRQYDKLGLVSPARVGGRNRLYSADDVDLLIKIAEYTSVGLSLSSIIRIIELEEEVRKLTHVLEEISAEKRRTALVVWRKPVQK